MEGGNTDIQKRFIQLFQLLPNSDNFFRNIALTFNNDIFLNLKDPFSENVNLDNQNLAMLKDKLRFLQLLTENHNLFLQNYLREQSNNRISYNFVNILIEYLSMLLEKLGNLNDKYNSLSQYTIELYYKRLLSLLDTICEFLQGPCKNNQEYLINTKIVELFNRIMEETCFSSDEDHQNEEKDENELDYNTENNSIFLNLSNKKYNQDSFFTETINTEGATTDDLVYNDNLKQNKFFLN